MQVTVMEATKTPIYVISKAAGISHGRFDVRHDRVRDCIRRGHLGVLEHVTATLRIEGISRACSHQLVRHRLASFVEVSQRYVELDTGGEWYVMPDAFVRDSRMTDRFISLMDYAAGAYKAALAAGMPMEDARYLLPQATKTSVVMTCNLRELWHIIEMRTAADAQWEIRDMANAMLHELRMQGDDWATLLDWLEVESWLDRDRLVGGKEA